MKPKAIIRKFKLSGKNEIPWHLADEFKIEEWYRKTSDKMPDARVKLLYTDERLYVRFDVKEDFIHAIHTDLQAWVCKDTCVEFFLSVDGTNYINYEMNCIGVYMCFKCRPVHQFERNPKGLKTTDFMVRTSLPQGKAIPEPVKCPPEGYFVEFSIPFDFLKGVFDCESPSPGTAWKANFYKCGSEVLTKSHWGSWSKIEDDSMNFHTPEYFGDIVFA